MRLFLELPLSDYIVSTIHLFIGMQCGWGEHRGLMVSNIYRYFGKEISGIIYRK